MRAYKAWLTVSGITSGPAFRAIDRHGNMSGEALTDKAMARILKRSIVAAETLNGGTMEEAETAAARCARPLATIGPRHIGIGERCARAGQFSASCGTRNSTPP